MATEKVNIIYDTLPISRKEAEEMFRIVRNIVDDLYFCRKPKDEWPLYDKLARYLGENSLAQHNEALRLRDEEETFDERFEEREDEDGKL